PPATVLLAHRLRRAHERRGLLRADPPDERLALRVAGHARRAGPAGPVAAAGAGRRAAPVGVLRPADFALGPVLQDVGGQRADGGAAVGGRGAVRLRAGVRAGLRHRLVLLRPDAVADEHPSLRADRLRLPRGHLGAGPDAGPAPPAHPGPLLLARRAETADGRFALPPAVLLRPLAGDLPVRQATVRLQRRDDRAPDNRRRAAARAVDHEHDPAPDR